MIALLTALALAEARHHDQASAIWTRAARGPLVDRAWAIDAHAEARGAAYCAGAALGRAYREHMA